MAGPRRLTAEEAAALIEDGSAVVVAASGGGFLEPDEVLAAVEARFLRSGHPRDLTVIHALGFGDRRLRGTNRFAHEGMTRRVIGGGWMWSPRLVELADENKVEAYTLPSGVISLLLRESGVGRPGLITKTGIGTFADPRLGGGRANRAATEPVVDVMVLDGEEYLRYRPLRVDVALVRGSEVDARGNVSCAREPGRLDVWEAALAAKGRRGLVIAQVKREVAALDPQLVHLPHVMVDAVVVAPGQWQTYEAEFDPALFGANGSAATPALHDPIRGAIARRAAMEVPPRSVLNVGFGMSALVVNALAEAGRLNDVTLMVEQGMIGGIPIAGDLFGIVRGPTAIHSSTQQFEVFHAGLLDACCLGMGQMDAAGSVNVSRLQGRVGGPGGFVDISQHAHKAIFCGTFTTGGLQEQVEDGRIRVVREGSVPKLVSAVDEITYSGPLAIKERREAVFVTERAVFRLRPEGIELVEVADGISIERDVLAQMTFRPIVRDVKRMSPEVFRQPVAISGERM